MSGVLGIRATTKQLSPFIEKALRNQDWELLEKTLALSEEGRMGEGVIEKVALEQLVAGRADAYREIKERFGTISFDEEQVQRVYNGLLHRPDTLKKVRTETGIHVDRVVVQEEYETLPAKSLGMVWNDTTVFELLRNLQTATNQDPEMNKKVREGLVHYFNKSISIKPEDLTHCQKLFGLYNDGKLAPVVQQELLIRGELDLFGDLYASSETKLSESKVKTGYRNLSGKNDLEGVYKVTMATGVAPQRQILKRVYSDLLETGKLRGIEKLSEKIGIEPSYDQEVVNRRLHEVSGRVGRGFELRDFRDLVNIVKKGNCKIPEEYVHEAAKNRIASFNDFPRGNSFNDCIALVDELYTNLSMNPSSEVTSAKISGITKELSDEVSRLEEVYTKS
jgi:hypothetical protein